MVAVYKELNMNTLEDCMNRRSTTMQKFAVCIWINDAPSSSWFGRLKFRFRFLQLANDLRGSALISKIHVRLRKMANKADDTHNKVEIFDNKVEDIDNKVGNIHKYLVRSKRSATLLPSDTVV